MLMLRSSISMPLTCVFPIKKCSLRWTRAGKMRSGSDQSRQKESRTRPEIEMLSVSPCESDFTRDRLKARIVSVAESSSNSC